MPMHKTQPIYKTCPTCGMSFPVCPPGKASRTYPKSNQVFCSRPCSLKSRYRRGGKCAELSKADAAYIAGFLDGEGSVLLYRRRDKAALRVVFANTNLEILEWIAEVANCGSIVVHVGTGSPMHKQGYLLQFNAEAAESLLRQVRPFLHIKVKQADLAMLFQERLRDPALNADRVWQNEYRATMQSMNQRGPRA